MKNLEEATEDFIEAVRQTPEYEEFAAQREKIRRYPELKSQIDEYRQKNYEMQMLEQPDVLFDRMDEFNNQYEKFREDPLVNDFLSAELGFCRLMQRLNTAITDELDFD